MINFDSLMVLLFFYYMKSRLNVVISVLLTERIDRTWQKKFVN